MTHTDIAYMRKLFFASAAWILAALPATGGQFGTGFAVTPDGYLVTCAHVVADAKQVVVHHHGHVLGASVVTLDKNNDLALLRVNGWRGNYLAIADAASVRIASDVIAAGFPDPNVLGKNPKVSKGIVNATSGIRDDPRHLQISVPLQPGNSGGPVFSPTGQVVGVVTAGLNFENRMQEGGYIPQSVNYALKSNYIFPLLASARVPLPNPGPGGGRRSIDEAIQSIALVESLSRGERPSASPQPQPQYTGGPQYQQPVAVQPTPQPANQHGPWLFPDSHQRMLSTQELSSLNPEQLWQARNELFLRRGYIFNSERGRQLTRRFGNQYRPVTTDSAAVQQSFNPIEAANLRAIMAAEG